MPSTPRCQEIPRSAIQLAFSRNWKPLLDRLNSTRTATLRAPVATANRTATNLAESGRRLETSAVSRAPMAGTTTTVVSNGKPPGPAASTARTDGIRSGPW